MIERAAIDFAAGRSRIFISGLSAGAAILHLRLRRICAGGIRGHVQRFLDAFERVLSDRVRGASIAKGNTWCEMC